MNGVGTDLRNPSATTLVDFCMIFLLLSLALQVPDSTAYLDRDARVLVARARAARDSTRDDIRAYTAVVKQRVGVTLRTPLKDRTIFRNESAARVRWSRDHETLIRVLGARQWHPGSNYTNWELHDFAFDEVFDPTLDRLYFGLTDSRDKDVWIDHPLLAGSEANYRFRTGDTITMSFPDGKRVRVVQLHVLPRTNQPRLISGSIWIEPVSGSIVKAAFRSASKFNLEKDTDVFEDDDDLENVPGVFKPFELDVTMISIEYSYWRLKHWLPRSMRFEGTARAGIVTAPAAMEMAYDIEDVVDETDPPEADSTRAVLRAWRNEVDTDIVPRRQNGKRVYVILPEDRNSLFNSPDIPPPIWENAPEFISEKQLREMYGGLADLPLPPVGGAKGNFEWGLRRELIRYNRVESLSVGARGDAQFTQGTLSAIGRIGFADLHPNLELTARRETLRRTVTLSGGHALTAVDPHSLSLGASAAALLLGRDDGEYYRTTGARFTISPPPMRAEWYRFSVFAEQQRSVDRETNISIAHLIDRGHDFRPNFIADRADLAGAELSLRGWWGTDPRGWQAGLETTVEAARGDFAYERGSITARLAAPVLQNVRFALEAGAGTSEGKLPAQKQFFLGGARTLRGYAGSAAVGSSFARGRAELAITRPEFGVSFFSDAGWAGNRADFATSNALLSAGVGATIMDGLIRVDLARALRKPKGWRLELYLDAIL